MRDILVVDGTCVFCNRLAMFILRHDRAGRFGFTHQQSAYAKRALERHGRVVWPSLHWLGHAVRLVQMRLLDLYYRWFARVRYRLVGKYQSCRVPTAEERSRFVE